MDNMDLFCKLQRAEKYFVKEKFKLIVSSARELFEKGLFDSCAVNLDKLPSDEEVLSSLVKKLKGKSVYKTLKRLQENKMGNDVVTAKCLSSLLTHVIIECEHGNNEFALLIPGILEKLSETVYNVF